VNNADILKASEMLHRVRHHLWDSYMEQSVNDRLDTIHIYDDAATVLFDAQCRMLDEMTRQCNMFEGDCEN
jgi:hypothetical protein